MVYDGLWQLVLFAVCHGSDPEEHISIRILADEPCGRVSQSDHDATRMKTGRGLPTAVAAVVSMYAVDRLQVSARADFPTHAAPVNWLDQAVRACWPVTANLRYHQRGTGAVENRCHIGPGVVGHDAHVNAVVILISRGTRLAVPTLPSTPACWFGRTVHTEVVDNVGIKVVAGELVPKGIARAEVRIDWLANSSLVINNPWGQAVIPIPTMLEADAVVSGLFLDKRQNHQNPRAAVVAPVVVRSAEKILRVNLQRRELAVRVMIVV